MSVVAGQSTDQYRPSRKIFRRLELYFATLTVLCACVLAIGNDGAVVPIIAIFFAIVGYVFVDVLKVMALPTTAAYIAMALAAAFCIVDFTDVESAGPRQLLAVGHLLVLVQAILMMQRKSKRVFEQLAIFCLLELIVAAVFNHAISFGLLLIPIMIIAATAFGLLAAVTATECESGDSQFDPAKQLASAESSISVCSGSSTRSVAELANQYSKLSVAMLVPAILLVAAVFFYALPRTSEASRISNRGKALVGFSDQVRLEQLGEMLRDPKVALRIKLIDRSSGDSYTTNQAIYLRGRVLEKYQAKQVNQKNTATWSALPVRAGPGAGILPSEYFSRRGTDRNFYDTVNVSVVCEAIRSDSLFFIAPYHRLNQDREIVHLQDRWTVRRRDTGDWVHPQIEYSFGSNAFHNGVQSELIARDIDADDPASREYRMELLDFDRDAMPTIAKIAGELSTEGVGELSSYVVAKSIEQAFSRRGSLSVFVESGFGVRTRSRSDRAIRSRRSTRSLSILCLGDGDDAAQPGHSCSRCRGLLHRRIQRVDRAICCSSASRSCMGRSID